MKLDAADATVQALRGVLGRSSRRAQVVASNLANVDTPGYRALEVYFPDPVPRSFDIELQGSSPGHLSPVADESVRGRLTEAPVTRTRMDGNTVDVDREMTHLAMSSGRYRSAVEMLRKRFALLVYAASDGGAR